MGDGVFPVGIADTLIITVYSSLVRSEHQRQDGWGQSRWRKKRWLYYKDKIHSISKESIKIIQWPNKNFLTSWTTKQSASLNLHQSCANNHICEDLDIHQYTVCYRHWWHACAWYFTSKWMWKVIKSLILWKWVCVSFFKTSKLKRSIIFFFDKNIIKGHSIVCLKKVLIKSVNSVAKKCEKRS